MNRIEFMTELAALLQDVPVIERQEAMKYYNDYFDDAGSENEQQVIEELESPARVAAIIKADLGFQGEEDQSGKYGEYSEAGYTDTRFEHKEMPAGRNSRNEGGYQSTENENPPRTSPILKVLLIIAIIIVGFPIILPVAVAVIAVIFAVTLTIFILFFAVVIASFAVAVTGVILFFTGIVTLIPEIAVGLGLIGAGLILGVLGTIGTVAGVKLCIVGIPGICRGVVWVCRKPFHRKAVA